MFQLKGTRSSERRLRDKPADKCLRVRLHQLFQTLVPGLRHSDGLLPLSFSVAYVHQAVEEKDIHKHTTFDPFDHRAAKCCLPCSTHIPFQERDLTIIHREWERSWAALWGY